MTSPDSHVIHSVDEGELQLALQAIAPMLVGHGGDLELTGNDEGIVSVAFRGACESCPAIAVTYAGLVRTYLLQVSGVREVRTNQVHASARALDRIAGALGSPRLREHPQQDNRSNPRYR
jgi:Fe-S cluster biogenesis protein NfuA